jgi:hypothetical protein
MRNYKIIPYLILVTLVFLAVFPIYSSEDNRSWHTIGTWSFSFYSPDSIRNISLQDVEGENAFRLTFQMNLFVYNGSILTYVSGSLKPQNWTADENGIYSIDLVVHKENQFYYPPPGGYKIGLRIVRPDGLTINSSGFNKSVPFENWDVTILGGENSLIIVFNHPTNWINFSFILGLFGFIILFSYYTYRKLKWRTICLCFNGVIAGVIIGEFLASPSYFYYSYIAYLIYILAIPIIILSILIWKSIHHSKNE